MPRSKKCPDPALLQAYADGTLFSRDVSAVELHVAKCEKCAAALAVMRRERDRAAASTWSRPSIIGAAAAAIVVGGTAAWFVWPGPSDAPASETVTVGQPEPESAATSSASTAPVESPPPIPAPTPTPTPAPTPAPAPRAAAVPAKPAPVVAARPQPAVKETPPADANPPAESAALDGVVLRGTRRSNRQIMWRARDLTIEHSSDGGMTWTSEYTTDRAVRAGAFVSADVAWLAGDSGLVLRRTKNGWFGTTSPGDGNITGIRASSPGKAIVTFDDGRVFSTENGGVTWAPQ